MKQPPDYAGAENVTISASIEVTAGIARTAAQRTSALYGQVQKAFWLVPKRAACAPMSHTHEMSARW